jgi:hypothetical protein
MIEPKFLSVPELAERWQQTERQILEHGLSMRLPLFFLFDGLVFDINDQWLRSAGSDYDQALREYDRLRDIVSTLEAMLIRNAAIRRGHVKPSEYEDLPLGDDDVKRYRGEIDAYSARIGDLTNRFELREHERRKRAYYGYLRVMPGTIVDIKNGKDASVRLAYLPGWPLTAKQIDGRVVVDGAIVELEGERVRTLTVDLLAYMDDVKAIEGGQTHCVERASQGSPGWQLVRPKRMDALTVMIYPLLEKAMANGLPIPKAREVMGELDATRPPGYHGLGDMDLKYDDDRGETRAVGVKALQKRIDRLIARPESR